MKMKIFFEEKMDFLPTETGPLSHVLVFDQDEYDFNSELDGIELDGIHCNNISHHKINQLEKDVEKMKEEVEKMKEEVEKTEEEVEKIKFLLFKDIKQWSDKKEKNKIKAYNIRKRKKLNEEKIDEKLKPLLEILVKKQYLLISLYETLNLAILDSDSD